MAQEIVTFTTLNDLVLEDTHFTLEDEFTLFFGVNGAGKSRTLRGITSALTGIACDVRMGLVVRIDVGQPWPSRAKAHRAIEAHGRTPIQALSAHLSREEFIDSPLPRERGEFEKWIPFRDTGLQSLRDLIDHRLGPKTDLTSEIRTDSLFLFVPNGTNESPAWDAWPVAFSNTALARSELARLDESFETYLDAEERVGFDAEMRAAAAIHDSTVRASPLFPSDDTELSGSIAPGHSLQSSIYRPYQFGAVAPEVIHPIPVIGRVDFGVDTVKSLLDINSDTSAYLTYRAEHELIAPHKSQSTRRHARPIGDGNNQPQNDDPNALDTAHELVSTVDSILTHIFPDFPSASLIVPARSSRFARPQISWRFGRSRAQFESLSGAEQWWMKLIISIAIHIHSSTATEASLHKRKSVLVLDEPEKGLHRSAESEMARGLTHLAATLNGLVVLASHSPHMLDIPGVRTFEVRKEADTCGKSAIAEIDWSTRDSLANLGLSAHDLLLWPRVFLAVEGEHDDELIDAWIGDRLRAARVKTLPLHGGKRLSSTVDSQVLFDFTDAHLVAVLDNVKAEHLRRTWDDAKALAASGRTIEAKQMIVTQLPDNPKSRGQEHSYLRPWLTKSIDKTLTDRITPYGFAAVDIVRYLPVERIVLGASSWAELDEAHQNDLSASGTRNPTPKDFKRWLHAKHGIDFTPALIRQAASDSPVPKEFELLAKTLEALSSSVAARR